jgi:nicotinamide riboside kinase
MLKEDYSRLIINQYVERQFKTHQAVVFLETHLLVSNLRGRPLFGVPAETAERADAAVSSSSPSSRSKGCCVK